MSDFSASWYGMKETPDIGITAMGGGGKNDKNDKNNNAAHYSLIMQLEHTHGWLEQKGKKMSSWAHKLVAQSKTAMNASDNLRSDMIKNVDAHKKLLREKVHMHQSNKKTFDDFISLLRKAFPDDIVIKKRISETVKLHELFIADGKKAKDLIK